ncbi:MAG: sigma 54-interacting transcriptional regulator [Acidobacteria bacterium]|nr:sigma 54-interacting transcriptional regulator [Acidobacteriota bacterium]
MQLLLRAIVFHPSAPVLITDDHGKTVDASIGAARFLGIPRDRLVGVSLDELIPPPFKPEIVDLYRSLQERGEREGSIQVLAADRSPREVGYSAKAEVLPVRHVVALGDGTTEGEPIPSWVKDYALFLLDPEGHIVAWYAGATRIYGYPADEAIDTHVSGLQPADESMTGRANDELKRVIARGHLGTEGWHSRRDGSRFWANSITLALRDEAGQLQGFARVVRDFTERRELDEKLRRSRAQARAVNAEAGVAGVISGEFERIPEANDAFLTMVGYTQRDMAEGRVDWMHLTPAEYAGLDELAHEEALQSGACSPYEKELIRQDGTRVRVLVVTAIVKVIPFRWITVVQDLREPEAAFCKADLAQDEEDEECGVDIGALDFDEMAGQSMALRRVQRQIAMVAPTGANVLVLGETGTGKELIARAVHRLSKRSQHPFVSLNCAAIPTGLLESELFGYERGAFTGALTQKMGRFEMAHKGTLFLDEVGDIPVDLQPKLLRALQEKSFERLGGTKTIPIDVRLVAATNRNLAEMMGEKLFRSDLYYRLNVFPITSPPLRDRAEDIPLLARHFVAKYAAKMERPINTIPPETIQALMAWHWPGNIREMENFIERSVILSRGTTLRAPLGEIRAEQEVLVGGDVPAGNASSLEQVERVHILRALRECGGVITTAAARLGLHRTTLNAMMKKLGISRKDI